MKEKFVPVYVADEVLGEGAFGRVYRIHNQRAEDFALKVVKPKFAGEPGLLENEVRVLSRLSHPNLLAIHEFIPRVEGIQGIEEKGAGYVMEFISGKTLDEVAAELKFSAWEELLVQALRALHYLHTRHLLHGDLKPSNLRLGHKNILKVLDFGLATRLGEKEGQILGTLDFMAPEALQGRRSPKSDLFSLGVVFYRLMAGRLPYDSQLELSQRFLQTPPRLGEVVPEIPEYFGDVLARLLESDANRRFSSALNVIRAINQHIPKPYEISEGADSLAILKNVPFVGRRQFLEAVDRDLEAWISDQIKAPLWKIHGPTGSGKTRFFREVEWQAKLRGLDTRVFSDEKEVINALTEMEASSAPALWFFSDLQELSPPALQKFQKFLGSFEVKGRHLALVLEWNDDGMGKELKACLEAAQKLSQEREIVLGPLSFQETQDFLSEIFFEKPLREENQKVIFEATEGNPSLLTQTCRGILQAGGLALLDKGLTPENLEAISPPENLKKTVADQWEGWTPLRKKVLLSTALLGREVAPGFLAKVLGESEAKIHQVLADLSSLHWLRPLGSAYQFTRILYLHFLVELFGKSEAKKLQGQLLNKLLSLGEKDDARLAALAWGAGDFENFRKHGMKAAQDFVEGGEPERGIRLYQDLLTVSPTTLQQTYIQAYLAAAYGRLNRWDEALESYARWYELTEDDGTDIQTIKYHYLTGTIFLNRGDLKMAKEKLGLALSTGDSERFEHHIPFHLKSQILLGKVHEKEGNLDLAQEIYEKGLKLARADSPDKTQLLRNIGLLRLSQKDFPGAKDFLNRSLQMSRDLNYDEGIANTAYVLANLAQQEGQYEHALKTYGQVLEIARKVQDPLKMARTYSNMAAVLVEIADYARAREQAEKARALFEKRGGEFDRLLNGFHLLTLRTYLGNYQSSEDQELANVARKIKSNYMLAYLDRLRGESLRLKRDFKEALLCFAQARQGFEAAGEKSEVQITRLHEILTECLAGDLPAARERFQEWKVPSQPENHGIRSFHALLSFLLPLTQAPSTAALQEKLQEVLKSGLQELVILTLLGCSEILTRLNDQAGAELLRRKANEWLEGLYRALPEEMQLSFEHREDFKRLVEAHLQKLKSAGVSRESFVTFARINKRLSAEGDMNSILQQVMDSAMALAGAERGFLLINADDASKTVIPGYRVEAARNMKKENIGTEEFKISLSVVEEAIRRRVSILTDDAQADPNFKDAESVHLYHLKSILVLPLVGEGGCIGALYLDHRFEVGAFSEEGLLFLKAFADQAVLAIEKAKTLAALNRAKSALENRVEEQAHQIEKMEAELVEARKGLKFGYEEIVGHSPKMIKILELMDRITDTQVPIWIHGESGTGKELIARALHYNSDRKSKAFITENCSAIPENLLESVLFGHIKGAFTHADRDKMGLFEAANGGTIFLDEIGDMPMPMQSKLLRVLQEGEIRRVGANEATPINVRVVTATNKNLPKMVQEGKFREDLFFRINGMKIELPSLRDRKEDIPPLVHHFIAKVAEENKVKPCAISEEALGVLAQYEWPGNIRELENTLRNAVLFSDGKTIARDSLGFKPELFAPPQARPREEAELAEGPAAEKKKVDAQREAILDALVRASFHKGQAAQELKVTPRHLYNLLEKYHLPKNKWALKKLVEDERGV